MLSNSPFRCQSGSWADRLWVKAPAVEVQKANQCLLRTASLHSSVPSGFQALGSRSLGPSAFLNYPAVGARSCNGDGIDFMSRWSTEKMHMAQEQGD